MEALLNRPLPSLSTLLKNAEIDVPVQRHLARVYALLCMGVACTTASAAAGVWAGIQLGWLSVLAVVGTMVWTLSETDPVRRHAAFFAHTCAQGLALVPLFDLVLNVDPSILVSAGLGAVALFGCLAGFALLSRRRSYLYLGGMLATCVSWMALGSLLNMWLRSPFLLDMNVWAGLAVFAAYVVVDTQVIVEKASGGSTDVVGHAMDLYLDFLSIAVRLIIILLRKQEDRERRERERQRRS